MPPDSSPSLSGAQLVFFRIVFASPQHPSNVEDAMDEASLRPRPMSDNRTAGTYDLSPIVDILESLA